MKSTILSLPWIMIKTSSAAVDFFHMIIDNLIYNCVALISKQSCISCYWVTWLPWGNLRADPPSCTEMIYGERLLFLSNSVYISSPALKTVVEQISGRGSVWLNPRETGLSVNVGSWLTGGLSGLSNCWALLVFASICACLSQCLCMVYILLSWEEFTV